GFAESQISLVDRERRVDGPNAAAYRETLISPNVGSAPPSGPVLPAAAVVADSSVNRTAESGVVLDSEFLGLRLGGAKALEFYRHAIANGATIIVVRTSAARSQLVRD